MVSIGSSRPGFDFRFSRGARTAGLPETPNVREDTNAVAQGIDAIGRGLSELVALRRQRQDFDALRRFQEVLGEHSRWQEATLANAPRNGAGVYETIERETRRRFDEFRATLTPEQQRVFGERIEAAQQNFLTAGRRTEMGLMRADALLTVEEYIERAEASIFENPDGRERYESMLGDLLRSAPNLTDVERREQAIRALGRLNSAGLAGRLRRRAELVYAAPRSQEAARWLPLIERQESGGNPSAISPRGAIGLMQIMPNTAREIASQLADRNFPHGGDEAAIRRYLVENPETNRRYGEHYFNRMLQMFSGDVRLALMAYNWGPGAVRDWVNSGMRGAVPQETQEYVRRIMRAAGVITEQDVFNPNLRVPLSVRQSALNTISAQDNAAGTRAAGQAQAEFENLVNNELLRLLQNNDDVTYTEVLQGLRSAANELGGTPEEIDNRVRSVVDRVNNARARAADLSELAAQDEMTPQGWLTAERTAIEFAERRVEAQREALIRQQLEELQGLAATYASNPLEEGLTALFERARATGLLDPDHPDRRISRLSSQLIRNNESVVEIRRLEAFMNDPERQGYVPRTPESRMVLGRFYEMTGWANEAVYSTDETARTAAQSQIMRHWVLGGIMAPQVISTIQEGLNSDNAVLRRNTAMFVNSLAAAPGREGQLVAEITEQRNASAAAHIFAVSQIYLTNDPTEALAATSTRRTREITMRNAEETANEVLERINTEGVGEQAGFLTQLGLGAVNAFAAMAGMQGQSAGGVGVFGYVQNIFAPNGISEEQIIVRAREIAVEAAGRFNGRPDELYAYVVNRVRAEYGTSEYAPGIIHYPPETFFRALPDEQRFFGRESHRWIREQAIAAGLSDLDDTMREYIRENASLTLVSQGINPRTGRPSYSAVFRAVDPDDRDKEIYQVVPVFNPSADIEVRRMSMTGNPTLEEYRTMSIRERRLRLLPLREADFLARIGVPAEMPVMP